MRGFNGLENQHFVRHIFAVSPIKQYFSKKIATDIYQMCQICLLYIKRGVCENHAGIGHDIVNTISLSLNTSTSRDDFQSGDRDDFHIILSS